MNAGADLKRAVREVPPWGWGIIGIGGLYLVLHHAKTTAAAGGGTLPGPITQAQDPLSTSDPSGGMSAYIQSLNSGYLDQANLWTQELANLQETNAQLLQQGQVNQTPPPIPPPYDPGTIPPGVIQPTVPTGSTSTVDATAPEQVGYTVPEPQPVAYASPSPAYVAPPSPYVAPAVYPTYAPPPPPYTAPPPAPSGNMLDPHPSGAWSPAPYYQPTSGGYVAPSLSTVPIFRDPLTTPQPVIGTDPLSALTLPAQL